MPRQIVVMVTKSAVLAQHERLYNLLHEAKDVRIENTFTRVREAENALNRAYELFDSLQAMELLDGLGATREDLDRIRSKIDYILEEKRRKDILRKH